jgi:hypothetical protein
MKKFRELYFTVVRVPTKVRPSEIVDFSWIAGDEQDLMDQHFEAKKSVTT